MDKTQKIIVVFLIMSILLSTISVVVSLSALNIELPQFKVKNIRERIVESGSAGNVVLVVEKAPQRGGG